MPGKKRYTMVLNFGYAESGHMGYVPWTSFVTFKDAKEALVDLAQFLKEQYLLNNEVKPKACCIKTKEKIPDAERCAKCGYLVNEPEFDGEEFEDWLRQLNTDTDTFAGLVEYDREARWQSNGLEGAPNPRFVYQAEWVLSAALGHPHHEDVTFEKICKNRTKSKSDSFTYY
jgi:hypothetical protein